jgi:hypothetical protein
LNRYLNYSAAATNLVQHPVKSRASRPWSRASQLSVMALHVPLFVLILGIGRCTAQAVVGTPFVQAGAVNLAANTVKLPLHRATLPDNTAVYFIVTEASSKDAAAVWGASHAAALAQTAGSAVLQQGVPVGTPSATGGVTPAQTLRLNATVNFLHGTRRVTPDPSTGFPPTNFSFSAQGNAGKC